MTLRAKLGLLFLGAVQVAFFTAVGAFWAVQSWQLLTDDLTMIHAQNLRLERLLEKAGGGPGIDAPSARVRPAVLGALRALREHAQTQEETERIAPIERLLGNRHGTAEVSAPALKRAARSLKAYYHAQVGVLRSRARFVTRLSTGLFIAIVVVVLGAMMAYFTAVRVWLVRPIQALGRATAIISTGNLEHRIPVRTRDELGSLAGSINSMAASLGEIQSRLVIAERFAAIGEMSAYVAHNIRNPLASVRATAQGELVDLAGDDPRRQAFSDIVVAADRLESWVQNLLRFSSPVTLEHASEDVNALVQRCVDLIRPRLAAKGLALALALDPGLTRVTLDRDKMEQVVSVVLNNAVDASPAGGTIDVASVLHTGLPGGAETAIRVGDRGGGIPRDRLAQVFTPFKTTKRTGTGLGLSLARKIVTAHHGTVVLTNRDGGGTVAEIRLPADARS